MTDDVDDRDRDRDSEARIPSFWTIDKKLSLLAQAQDIFQKEVARRFDVVEKRVDDVTSKFATKEDLAAFEKRFEAHKSEYEKYTSRVWTIVQFLIIAFLGAVASVVFIKGGVPH